MHARTHARKQKEKFPGFARELKKEKEKKN
jgi:hypothetical protein